MMRSHTRPPTLMIRSQHRALVQERLRAGGGGTSAADPLPPFHAATLSLETPGSTTGGVLSGAGSGVKSITRAQEHHSSGASSRVSSQWGTPYKTPVGERDSTRERAGAYLNAQPERLQGAPALASGWGTPVDVSDIADISAGGMADISGRAHSLPVHSGDRSRGGAGAAGGPGPLGRGGTEALSRRSLDYLGGL